MSKRSERQRTEKYKTRATAMLDRFHWQKEEEFFLGLIESGVLTTQEIRELPWGRIKNTYEGLTVFERPLVLREEILAGLREMLRTEIGLYGESFSGKASTSPIFTKDTLKNVTRELDQFKDV